MGGAEKATHSSVRFPLFSHRFGKPFSGVSVNCQCFPAQLQEHQLFFFFVLFLSLPRQKQGQNHHTVSACSQLLLIPLAKPKPTMATSGSHVSQLSHGVLLPQKGKPTGLIHSGPQCKKERGWNVYSFCSGAA